MTPGDEMTPGPSRAVRRAADAPPLRSEVGRTRPRWSRSRGVLSVFAAMAAVGFVAAYVGPIGVSLSKAEAVEPPATLYSITLGDAQSLRVSGTAAEADGPELARGNYEVYVTPTPTPTPTPTKKATGTSSSESEPESESSWTPPFASPDPGSAQSIAFDMVMARGWSNDDFSCLVALWNRESGWRVNAYNAGSGAYGIPQALPGNKMASAGADWETSAATQIAWGLGYIGGRYGTPCGAWAHSNSSGWY
ncbi:lytic transglycosylase domain-containing protein [Microbacterium sp. P03]|uniref:aggregation-promoting factor C-terminal-like domain-containing protein n=1 Tax=Microbacterium sp. P03 TaxID=3366946 RepID=UPI003744C477